MRRSVSSAGIRLLMIVGMLLAPLASVSGEEAPGWTGMAVTRGQSGDGSSTWLSVCAVRRGGPAEAAGLRAQDPITRIDGKPVGFKSEIDILKWSAGIKPGQKIVLTVRRTGEEKTLTSKAVKMPQDLYERWKLNFQFVRPQVEPPPTQ